jgi:glycerol kinase
VDGGVTKNQFLMQFQSDILNKNVYLPIVSETTALGAAYLAGLAVGFWSGEEEISENWKISKVYEPAMMDHIRQEKYDKWKFAVQKSMGWENQNV